MNYQFHSQFIFRTPLLPLQTNPLLEQELWAFSQQAFFKEAIYLASPVLYDELIKWHGHELKNEKEIQKLVIALYKYCTRMQSRCTPYGLFAACGVGTWGDESKIILEDASKRHTRLDMNYLCALAQQLNTHPVLLPLLRFYPNNSLYAFGESMRYVEYKYVNNRRVHQISSVNDSAYLQKVLQRAGLGILIDELVALLVDDEITASDAEAFIQELIQGQLLVSELEPAVTGDEFIYQLIRSLKALGTQHEELVTIIQHLEATQVQIEAIDQQLGNDVVSYRSIYHHLQALGTSIEENQLFQTDLYRIPPTASLNRHIQEQLLETIHFLNHFSSKNESANLKKFKENFYSQYEDSEVSLLEVLDTETGIGYTGRDTSGINALLDDIYIPAAGGQLPDIRWNKQQQFLHDQFIQAIKRGDYTVSLTDDLVKGIGIHTDMLPDTLAMMFRLVGQGKIYLQSCGGSSAANLLGRFAHGSEMIHQMIKDITVHEQSSCTDKILAEIVHLPESRLGNILLRPVLRNYEIPYLGKSAISVENQIPLQDLMVSVKNNKIILRSKKLDKEVIPRLSTAHNYSFNALPVYQFLCDLQTQFFEKSEFGFNWGSLSDNYQFLPRVEYKNVILARAKWQLLKSDFQILLDDTNPDYLEKIAQWRKHWNIPKQVVLAEGDNELLINFDDVLSLNMLVASVKKKDRIVLEEFLFHADYLLIKDQAGRGYTNEFIAILLKEKSLVTSSSQETILKTSMLKNSPTELAQRSFSLGSEWLYYKFYCGVKIADGLLADVIKPLADILLERKWIDQFFFIRYADPDLHIRVRFYISDTSKLGEVIKTVKNFIAPRIRQGLITRVQTDTYKRELERYGVNSIAIAESIFFIDSMATLQLIDAIDGEAGEQIRWQFALRSVDEFLNNFKLSRDRKISLLEQLKNAFIQEHGEGKGLKIQLDVKFRKVRNEVTDILNRELDATREIRPLIDLLEWKSREIQPLVDQVLELQSKQQLQVALNDLIASYTHMMLNRIFKARQRTYEMLMYDWLYRYHTSLARREKSEREVVYNV